MMNEKMKHYSARSGYALATALLLMFVISSFAAILYRQSSQALFQAQRSRESHQALLVAQSAIGYSRGGMLEKFTEYYKEKNQHPHQIPNWFHFRGNGKVGTAGEFYDFFKEDSADLAAAYPSAEIKLGINDVQFNTDPQMGPDGFQYVEVPIEAHVRIGNTTRAVREMVRCEFAPSDVFESAYFLNNFGWFYGVDITLNGDIRSNALMDAKPHSMVLNGTGYSVGTFSGVHYIQHWSRAYYELNASIYARPMLYPLTGQVDGETWEEGYDADGFKVVPDSAELKMPYLGDLEQYEEYADHNDGKVFQDMDGDGNPDLVFSVLYDGAGMNTRPQAKADDGTLVLIGTVDNPIILDGPVVVESDLVIGGVVKGQGTFFVGRNVHIIKDLTYENPPKWVKPLSDVEPVIQATGAADFLGLCAKGSVILGDYTRSNFENKYMQSGFVGTYNTDSSDADIGYCNTTKNGEPAFKGDYTAYYGSKPADNADDYPNKTVRRKYYSSSLSDKDFKSLNPSRKIRHIDAVVYNNHLFAGKLASGAQINGSLVCRNEAMILYGHLEMNWDTRLNGDPRYEGDPTGMGGGTFAPYLPVGDPEFSLLEWSEIQPSI